MDDREEDCYEKSFPKLMSKDTCADTNITLPESRAHVNHVHEIIKWNENNMLYPTRSFDPFAYDMATLRQCIFCFVRYVNHPDPKRIGTVIKRSLSSGKPGLEFLYGLLWQLSISKTSSARSRVFSQGIDLLNEDLRNSFLQQRLFIDKLKGLYVTVRAERKALRTDRLRSILFTEPFLLFEPVILPLEGLPCVDGIIPEESLVFSSAQSPLLLSFRTTQGSAFRCILKEGDDVRQDHMTIQIIRFINSVLCQAKIDLGIMTYDVTATSLQGGLIQFIPAEPLSKIIASEGGLKHYLTPKNHKKDAAEQLHRNLVRFTKSLCGYTLITYLLCIGDRHLDNILLTQDGTLFHIDFSFLGREPKPFAPEVKLCPEIIELLGGKSSGYYQLLINLSIKSFRVLRQNKAILLDYIHSFCIHGVADVNVSLLPCIDSRFMSSLSDQDAYQNYIATMERGFESVMPRIMDKIHALVT